MDKLTTEELKNTLVLVKAGQKNLDLNGDQMIMVAVIVKKIEEMVAQAEPKKVEKEEEASTTVDKE